MEVEVIESAQPQDIFALSKLERDVFIKAVIKDANLPKRVGDDLIKVINTALKQKRLGVKSSMTDILLKNVISLVSELGHGQNYLAIPVLEDIDHNKDKRSKKIIAKENIKTKFGQRILATTYSGLHLYPAIDEEVAVVGLLLNPFCSQPKTVDHLRREKKINDEWRPNLNNATSGIWTAEDIIRWCSVIPEVNFNFKGKPLRGFRRLEFNEFEDRLDDIFDYFYRAYLFFNSQKASAIVATRTESAIYGRSKTTLDSVYKKHMKADEKYRFIQPKIKETELIKFIQNLYGYKVWLDNYDLLTLITYTNNLLPVFLSAVHYGIDHPDTVELAEAYKERQARLRGNEYTLKLELALRSEMENYKILVAEKFGKKRIDKIISNTIITKLSDITSQLSSDELKIIEAEQARRKKQINAVANNDCPHLKAVQKVYKGSSKLDKLGLIKSFEGKVVDGIQQCKLCGFHLLCTHMKTKLKDNDVSAMYPFISKNIIGNHYACKFCGEAITDITIQDSFTENTGGIEIAFRDEDLYNTIGAEIYVFVLRLTFEKVIDTNRFINTIKDDIYPYIHEKNKNIQKSRTMTEDEMSKRIRYQMDIYGMAYIIQLLLSNKYIKFKGVKPVKDKPLVALMLSKGVDIINRTKQVNIRELNDVSLQTIKVDLVNAFKEIQKKGVKQIRFTEDIEDFLISLVEDPLYNYFYWTISEKGAGRDNAHRAKNVEKILGKTLAEALQADSVFDKVENVSGKFPDGKKFKNIKADEKKNPSMVFAEVEPHYIAESYRHIKKYMEDKVYLEMVGGESDKVITHTNTFLDLKAKEEILYTYRTIAVMKNYVHYPPKKYAGYRYKNTDLGRIYDENGNPHKWTLYEVADGKSMTTADINEQLQAGKRFSYKDVKTKCSICGVLKQRADQLNEDIIRLALDAKQKGANFFQFYETRCPAGGKHEGLVLSDTDSQCKKCEMKREMIQKPTGPDSIKFYKKWRSKYSEDHATLNREFMESSHSTNEKIKGEPEPPEKSPSLKDFSFQADFSVIQLLASKMNVVANLITTLGSKEGRKYKDIISGEYIPSDPTTRIDTRIYVINNYIHNLLFEYNLLRFYNKTIKPKPHITELIKDSGIKVNLIPNFVEKIPDINDDYSEKFDYVQANFKPRDIITWLKQTFAEKILKLLEFNGGEYKKVVHMFAKRFFHKLMREEELTTEHGYFHWSIFSREKEMRSSKQPTGDPNFQEGSEEPTSELGDQNQSPEDFEEKSPFSTDAFDMEDEDGGVDINVEFGGLE